MSLESPFTYGEAYWKLHKDALLSEKETLEKELIELVAPLFAGIKGVEGLPGDVLSFLNGIEVPKFPAGGALVQGLGAQAASTVTDGFLGAALQDYKYALNEKFSDLRIDAQVASILKQRGLITEEFFNSRMKSNGFKEAEGMAFYDALRPYPDITDIMTYGRYLQTVENPKEFVWERFDVHERDYPIWQWLSLMHPSTDNITTLLKWGFLDVVTADDELTKIGWGQRDREMIKDLSYSLPNAMLLIQGGLLNELKDDDILTNISKGDIHPDFAQTYLDAVLTKPSTEDIIRYERRLHPELEDLDQELRKIGIHPQYFDLYKELAYFIPPVQDLITMAVREVFSPSVASRFGQYQDFPHEFRDYAAKLGVSEEWAERYWAAHWDLPSAQQGFEMLHRGAINEQDLDLLLRARDVMPFWRDKLKQIAFHPLTRVDIRRMYALNVLNESEVEESYRHLGYNQENAKRMTDFTVKYVDRTSGKLSVNDVKNSYVKGLLSDTEAIQLFRELGIDSEEAREIVESIAHKREWKLTEQKIKTIERKFKTEKITLNDAQNQLRSVNLGTPEIKVFIDRWSAEVENDLDSLWTVSQTLNFLKNGLITSQRASQELREHGFDSEHIQVYLQASSKQTE